MCLREEGRHAESACVADASRRRSTTNSSTDSQPLKIRCVPATATGHFLQPAHCFTSVFVLAINASSPFKAMPPPNLNIRTMPFLHARDMHAWPLLVLPLSSVVCEAV